MDKPLGLILAGGRGTRMGGVAKAGLMLGDQTLLDRCVDRLEPQVGSLVINANDNVAADHRVVPDTLPGHLGPLAGILAGLEHAARHNHSHVVSVAVDTPFFPCDLVPQLQLAALDHPVGFALAATPKDLHGTFGLWPVSLRDALHQFLSDGHRKLRHFAQDHDAATALFAATTPDGFFNINTPEDLKTATQWTRPSIQ